MYTLKAVACIPIRRHYIMMAIGVPVNRGLKYFSTMAFPLQEHNKKIVQHGYSAVVYIYILTILISGKSFLKDCKKENSMPFLLIVHIGS